MAKSNVTRMAGSPWHVETLHLREGEKRRHRSNCIYYTKETKHCIKRGMPCVGSSHCKYYREKSADKETERKVSTPPKPEHKVESFDGIKLIPMDKITARKKDFKPPSPEKAKKLREYYREHGELDKPVVVVIENGRYIVVDKYLRYFVAQQMQLKKVHAVMRQGEESLQEILHTAGRKVVHNTYGEGVIKKWNSISST